MRLLKQRVVICASALGLVISLFDVPRAFAADTTFIREFAKNKPRVFIVASGPQATSVAQTIKSAILRHPDNKHSAQDILALSFADAVTASKQQPDFARSPVIFLMDRQEMDGPMPPELGYLLPKQALATGYDSSVSAVLGGVRDQQVFTVALDAPNVDRLGRLLDIFSKHSAAGFRDLPFSEDWSTNRLNVFSDPANRGLAKSWGVLKTANVWNDITWHDLADYASAPPGALIEGSRVFFIDRSQNDTVPAPAADLLSTHKPTPTMIAMERAAEDTQGNGGVIVFSAPNTTILARKTIRYATRDAVPVGDTVVDAVDMRKLGNTTILIGGDLPDQDRQPIRFLMASHMRRDLGLTVWERGHGMQDFGRDISLDQVQGQGGVARTLRAAGVLYAWHYSISRFTGRTEYESGVKRLSPLPKPFDDTEPTGPSRSRDLFGHKMSDDEYAKAEDKYQKDHDAWKQKKMDYETKVETMSYDWRQTVFEKQSAHVRGTLRLVDLRDTDSGRVIWEHELEGDQDVGSVYRTKVVTVQGPNAVPPTLAAPSPLDAASDDVMRSALETARAGVFDDLMETALLPNLAADTMPRDDTGADPTPAPPAPIAKGGQVADIQNGVVTVTLGTGQGVQSGDTIQVVLSKRDIHDPNTGAVIDTRILDSVTLNIIQLGVTTDCVPATAADTAKLSKVKIGMAVQVVAR